jgi:serine/threonine protein phosphatase PrpC
MRGGWLGLRVPEAEDQQSWVLEDGDELLLATDGLFDQLEEFDWSGQVIGHGRLFDAVRQLVEQALALGPQRDDLTMVLVRRCPRPVTPLGPASSEENLSSFSAGGSR